MHLRDCKRLKRGRTMHRTPNKADNEEQREALRLILLRWRVRTHVAIVDPFGGSKIWSESPPILSPLRDRRPKSKRDGVGQTLGGEAQISQRGAVAGRASVSDAVSLIQCWKAAVGVARCKLRRVRDSVTAGPSRLRALHARRRAQSERFESERILGRRG